jgi:phosphatidate phosphatase APP1
MAQSGLSSTWGAGSGDGAGGRRRKVYGYFKAANELRQAYQAQWSAQKNETNSEDYYNTPGAFPDVEIARSGNEEMVLFPSYARRLTPKSKKNADAPSRRDSWSRELDEYHGVDTERHSDDGWDNPKAEEAVVEVDVRGWIYAPGREPMSKKHRLMITLARQLSGVPAPAANNGQNSTTSKGEDEYVHKQMETLVETAEKDADQAWKSSRVDQPRGTGQPTPLSKDEMTMANAQLMERLRPFLTNPIASLGVMAFFFNEEESVSRTLRTDESGHFTLRAALPFIPTHVRVLASEDLCAAKPIQLIEPTGISLISDIDDTVKHSAIASGAKEMFRNTFVRDLGELTVQGVSDWYQELAKRNVDFHYVSNAPWQLYPLLEKYFKLVGLPPGSFHMKAYSGMLQGIFEPTAERKRGNLEQLLRDFPERKFILVGDSGEADLEVYTDIVLANPGRILGIFIRDVTTTDKKPFFDQSIGKLQGSVTRSRSTPQLVDHMDSHTNRPALPPRRARDTSSSTDDAKSIDNGDLIDLRDEEEQKPTAPEVPTSTKPRLPPTKPAKPSSLRTTTASGDVETSSGKTKPPPPPVRRKAVPTLPPRQPSAQTDSLIDFEPSPVSRSRTESSMDERYSAESADAEGSVQGRSKQPPPVPPPRRTNTSSSIASSASSAPTTSRPPPPTPAKSSYLPSGPVSAAQAALQYATERLNLSPSPPTGLQRPSNQYMDRAASESAMPPAPLPNKREELWRRRWERASEILHKQNVVLSTWRVGSDAQPVCVWLVDEALKDMQAGAGRRP